MASSIGRRLSVLEAGPRYWTAAAGMTDEALIALLPPPNDGQHHSDEELEKIAIVHRLSATAECNKSTPWKR